MVIRCPGLEYTEENHAYVWQGVKVPHITGILKKFLFVMVGGNKYFVDRESGAVIPHAVMESASKVGSAIHTGCSYILTGKGLNWEALHPALVPPLRMFERWIKEEGIVEVLLCEEPLFSPTYVYAGRPDMLVVKREGKRSINALIEIKTGSLGPVGPQTAAQEQLVREAKVITRGEIKRYVLHLSQDGETCVMHKLNNPRDMQYFLHKLAIHNYDNNGEHK